MNTSTRASRGAMLAGTAAVLVIACALVWMLRPMFHGLAMLFYMYPLLTWMPIVGVLVIAGIGYGIAAATGHLHTQRSTGYYSSSTRTALVVWPAWLAVGIVTCVWIVCCIFQPAWSGHALYQASEYGTLSALPAESQPRILPKDAAQSYGNREDLKHAHLVVNPESKQLSWSAEKAPGGLFHSGKSEQIAVMPLDRIDGSMARLRGGFTPAISKVGAGSVTWKAYKDHFFTNVQERTIVPLPGGKFVAVSPYLGYKGFFVKHPYWKGVYVFHADGTREDLTPAQAMARPELANSGRLFPEKLAREIAEAYGYKNGIGNTLSGHKDEIEVSDPDTGDYYRAAGNPQPYLTNLGDNDIKWVTVGNPHGDRSKISRIFLTDSATGKTEVWSAPAGKNLLSNEGAFRVAYGIKEADGRPVEWKELNVCCDAEGYEYDVTKRWVTEPRPVFVRGRFYYLVSVIGDQHYVKTTEPVERTVLIDAAEGNVVHVYDHNKDKDADNKLRLFFTEGIVK